MHELSIALGIVDIATEELERQGGGLIVAVHVKVGALSGVDPVALRSAFELAREDSVLAEACLQIEPIAVTLFCSHCQSEQLAEEVPALRCPRCGRYSSDLLHGRELEVVAMEIES